MYFETFESIVVEVQKMRGSFVYVRKETRTTGHLLEAGYVDTEHCPGCVF